MRLTRARRDNGFTTVELMMVVAILGILVSIAVMSYVVATSRARGVTCHQNQRSLQESVYVYAAENETDAADIEDLRDYVQDFDSAVACPNGDGTELQYDPVSHEISCPNHP